MYYIEEKDNCITNKYVTIVQMSQGALLWVTDKVGHVCTYPYVRSMYKDVSISGGGKEKKRKEKGGW